MGWLHYIHSCGVVVIDAPKGQLIFFPGFVFFEDLIGEAEFRGEFRVRSKAINEFHGGNLSVSVLVESAEVVYYVDRCEML